MAICCLSDLPSNPRVTTLCYGGCRLLTLSSSSSSDLCGTHWPKSYSTFFLGLDAGVLTKIPQLLYSKLGPRLTCKQLRWWLFGCWRCPLRQKPTLRRAVSGGFAGCWWSPAWYGPSFAFGFSGCFDLCTAIGCWAQDIFCFVGLSVLKLILWFSWL